MITEVVLVGLGIIASFLAGYFYGAKALAEAKAKLAQVEALLKTEEQNLIGAATSDVKVLLAKIKAAL